MVPRGRDLSPGAACPQHKGRCGLSKLAVRTTFRQECCSDMIQVQLLPGWRCPQGQWCQQEGRSCSRAWCGSLGGELRVRRKWRKSDWKEGKVKKRTRAVSQLAFPRLKSSLLVNRSNRWAPASTTEISADSLPRWPKAKPGNLVDHHKRVLDKSME